MATSSNFHPWDHHEASLFQVPETVAMDPSGSVFRVPTIEKINEFHYNPLHGSSATLVCEGTHTSDSAEIHHSLMVPGRLWNLLICRYDAHPSTGRHTVQNLRVRVCEFRELQTRITIDHETGRTQIKKVMKFVFDGVGPMEVPTLSGPSNLSYLSTTSIRSTVSALTITSTTPWTSEVSTLSALSTLRAQPITHTS